MESRRLDPASRARKVRYEGNAVLWQGANRVQGDAIDVDRGTLTANGNVVTNLWEQPGDQQASPGPKKAPASPVLTVVHAQRLVYTDENRLAVYTGDVTLKRTGLEVKSRVLRAYLSEAGATSRLDKALADGSVEIVQAVNGRTRTGTGGHGEYYTASQKVVLHAEKGGKAKLVDSVSGASEGLELTYFANDDRLLGSGTSTEPVNSRVVRKK
jgi:lipopolysaccharide export system protein LptA